MAFNVDSLDLSTNVVVKIFIPGPDGTRFVPEYVHWKEILGFGLFEMVAYSRKKTDDLFMVSLHLHSAFGLTSVVFAAWES